jgi:hypothetical protein
MTLKRFAFAATVCLAASASLVACGSDDSSDGPKKDGKPSIKITSPKQHEKVGPNFTIEAAVENFTGDPSTVGKKNVKGRGHFHFALDKGKYDNLKFSSVGQLAKVLGTIGKYSPNTSPTVSYSKIPKGKHTIQAFLVNNDHSKLKGNGASDSVTFTVVSDSEYLKMQAAKVEPGIVAPAQGEKVGRNFVAASVMPKNFVIDASKVGKKKEKGVGHLFWQLDDGQYDVPKHSSSGKLAEKFGTAGEYSPGTTTSVHYVGIPKGKHTLRLYLVNNDHSKTKTHYKVTFTVV